jgi:hypothetical protein
MMYTVSILVDRHYMDSALLAWKCLPDQGAIAGGTVAGVARLACGLPSHILMARRLFPAGAHVKAAAT